MAVEPLIFELSKPGRRGTTVPAVDVPETEIPAALCRDELSLPEVSEIDVIRHFTRMSQKNHAIDIGFYPLGSCTMKYNPKINEWAARLPGFCHRHPYAPESELQGTIELMALMEQMLGEIAGLDAVSLQPAAGAQGEFLGLAVIRGYLTGLADNVDLTSVLLFEHRSLDKKSHVRHVPLRDKFESLWRDVLEEGVAKKTFAWTDTGLATCAIMGTLNWTLTWYHPNGPKSIEQIADEYSDFILKGMLR